MMVRFIEILKSGEKFNLKSFNSRALGAVISERSHTIFQFRSLFDDFAFFSHFLFEGIGILSEECH